MNEDEIIHMAQACGFSREDHHAIYGMLTRFAALVAAAEREECAKVCDSVVIEHPGRADLTADQCAAAIRARGEE